MIFSKKKIIKTLQRKSENGVTCMYMRETIKKRKRTHQVLYGGCTLDISTMYQHAAVVLFRGDCMTALCNAF